MHIKRIEKIIEDMNLDLPELVREGCRELLAQIGEKTARIVHKTKKLSGLSNESANARRFHTMPGVGPMTAMAVEAFPPKRPRWRAAKRRRCGDGIHLHLGRMSFGFLDGLHRRHAKAHTSPRNE
jgi:transposase